MPNPFDPSSNLRPDVMTSQAMPLNPAGLISIQAPPVTGASTTGSMASGSLLPENLPQPYGGFWSSFQTWAQNNPVGEQLVAELGQLVPKLEPTSNWRYGRSEHG